MEKLFSTLNIGAQRGSKKESFFANVFESITDGFFFVDNNWNVVYWNKSSAAILKVANVDIVGKNLWDVFKDAKEMDFYKQYGRSKAEHIALEFDADYPPKGLSLEIKTYPFEEGLAVYFKDVTFKRKVALELENTRKLQEAIINATSEGIWSIDGEFQLLTANEAYYNGVLKATGLKIEPGDNVFAGCSKEIVERRKACYERCLSGEKFTIEEEIEFETKAETLFVEISFNPILNQDGFITGVACFSRDITRQKQQQILIEQAYLKLAEREQSLQEVTVELETVLNSSLDLICSTNSAGEFIHVNNSSKHLLGYEPKELKGKNIHNFLHPDDVSKTLALRDDIKNGGRVTTFRNRMIKRNGKVLHLMWSSHWDADKQISFSVGRDASNLVQAELLKELSERRFTALIEKGADMVGVLGKDLRYKYVSPNVETISGYKVEDFLSLSPLELIHPEDMEIVQKQTADLFALGEGAVQKGIYRIKDAKGEWRWLETLATNLLGDPAIEGIVINSRDITERTHKDEELRLTNERFETILNVTNEVIWEWDLVSDKVVKNANHETIFGYKQDGNDTGKSWVSKIHSDDSQRVRSSVMKTIDTGNMEPWTQEYRYYRSNGEMAYVIDRGVLIKDKNGKAARMVGSMQDITERKKIENEREAIIAELTTINNDLKQFSFITSHNLRAPLSNILGLLNVIDYENLNDINQQLFEMLKLASTQLKETIQDLTDMIVIRNKANAGTEQVNIKNTFEQVKSGYLNTLHDIPFTLETDFQLEEVPLNKAFLSSIFINLVSNSIKYRCINRILKISITVAEKQSGICEITFTDNGIGLNTNRVKDRLFGMYQRFHDHIDGKGLGLFIVKSQVTAMGGTIKLVSEEDKGATFILTLPIKKAAEN